MNRNKAIEGFTRAWDKKKLRMVHVRELPKETRNGKNCDCICIEVDCKAPLEACQGDNNEWFFRHQTKTNCKGGPMTALHMHAQELLIGDQSIKTREGEVSYLNGENEWKITNSNYKADVMGLKTDGSCFLIEIFVTHKLAEEEDKVKYIHKNKIHSVEINLSKVDRNITKDDLLNLLLTDDSKQRTIYSPSTSSSLFNEIVAGIIVIASIFGLYKITKFIRKRRRRK
jgi:hypothetical protein